ncbi:MAG: CocE/NonD family hydrolase [Brumimicrobium sp.]|nr:CocE/NonD family hydrolase [Brumimicrobium sp.]
MKHLCTILLFLSLIFSSNSQIIPNGQIDNMDELIKKEVISIPMSDGTKLATNIYLPIFMDSVVTTINIGGTNYTVQIIPKNTQFIIYDNTNITKESYRLPIILTRTPYGKDDETGGTLFPMMGYAYATQDMRGRYESEGVYFPMYSDSWPKAPYHPNNTIPMDITTLNDNNNALHHHDGSETIYYLADSAYRIFDFNKDGINDTISYSNGRIGMFGASALGNTQYQGISDMPFTKDNPIKCYLPIVATNEHYNTTLFHNGVFRNSLVSGWITGQILNGVHNDSNVVDGGNIYNNIHSPSDYNYTDNLTLANDLIDWFVADELNGSPSGSHPTSIHRIDLDASMAPIDNAGYSQANGTTSRYKNLNMPGYHLTGWWDIFINGQIETFRKIKEQNPTSTQKLIIGPWTHQTIGSNKVGDMVYPDNVFETLNFDLEGDLDLTTDTSLAYNIYNSELMSWYKKYLGGEPYFIIPESNDWQTLGTNTIRIPSQNYIIPYYKFLNYLGGKAALPNVPFQLKDNGGNISSLTYAIPVNDDPLFYLPQALGATDVNALDNKKDIRMYISGPTNDNDNLGVGNYWMGADSLPFKKGITEKIFYLHQNKTTDGNIPTQNEGVLSYVANPNNPVVTIGGNNMIPKTPDNTQKSQGSMDLANPNYINLTMNRSDVLQFTSAPLTDTLTFVGFPKAGIYAKGHTTGYPTAKTDFDVMVRVVDVYPDGREMLITEGVVNARAREYAKSIFDRDTNETILLTNIDNNTYYYFQFDLLPLGHTFGKNHQIKFLLSSSNYPKYQSNPHLPNEDNEFFRWNPGESKTYMYQGHTYTPQNATITYEFNDDFPSYISLPQLNDSYYLDVPKEKELSYELKLYPNPTQGIVNIAWNHPIKGNVQIISLDGQLLLQKEIHTDNYGTSIDVSTLSKGIYLVRIPEMNQTKKLVIE